MKVRNIDLINYNNILNGFAEKHLPQKIGFAITKNIITISKELEPYQKSLEKVIENYKDFFVKDENDEIVRLSVGIPEVDTDHMDDYIKDVDELLSVEIDVELYTIEEAVFDYEDSERYDAMSATDILALRSVLCEKKS